MRYDWTGVRTMRIRRLKIAVLCVSATALATIPAWTFLS